MYSKFYCKSCDRIFDAEGTKAEYLDPVFGPCASYVANCPDCGTGSKEYFKPKQYKSSQENMPACGNPNGYCPHCQV